MYKKFVNKIIILILMATFIVISFNFIIDPYNVTKYNFLDIEHKLIKDYRMFKINQIKSFDSIDNLILGSSRSESLNPKLLDEYFGGFEGEQD